MVKKTELQKSLNNMVKKTELQNYKNMENNMVKKTELQETLDRLSRLEKLSQRGAYCGYRFVWSTANKVITYKKLMLSEGDAGVLVPATGVWTTRKPGLF